MTDRLFTDCCYGTKDQHGPRQPCPQLNEALQSISQSTADIQRWALLIAIKGAASEDRKRDISASAERIKMLAVSL